MQENERINHPYHSIDSMEPDRNRTDLANKKTAFLDRKLDRTIAVIGRQDWSGKPALWRLTGGETKDFFAEEKLRNQPRPSAEHWPLFDRFCQEAT